LRSAFEDYQFRSVAGAQTEWKGYWITSMRFYHLPSCHQYGHNRLPEFRSENCNVHTLFRKAFFLKDTKIRKAHLYITGDDLYQLYLNERFVGEGPAQSYPFAYCYNCYDVTDLLSSGKNVIGVHLYYQGLFNIYLISADNLCGMIAQLEIEYEDGSEELIVSDRSWQYKECDAYSYRYIYGCETQFSEDIDLNRYPSGWLEQEYPADAWSKAIVSANPYPMEYHLVPQMTPTVVHEKVSPVRICPLEQGYLLDFGTEVTGRLAIPVRGKRGERIELRFGEELKENGRVRYELRANCIYRDYVTLTGGEDFAISYDYKGYRYAEILSPPEGFAPEKVFTLNRHYPFPAKTAEFQCSDPVMNRIWDICKQGVRIGTQDTYYDCPTREKGGFVGDALITGLSHLILTGDIRIYRKFILDCSNAARYCPALMAHLPTYDINICADYSALFPLFLEQYYRETGDGELVQRMLPVAEGIWEYYSQFLTEDGVLSGIRHMEKVPKEMNPLLVDWPENLRDGYDMEAASKGVCTTVNMFFYGFLKTLSSLCRTVGELKRAGELETAYTRLGEGVIAQTYDRESGLFRDASGSEHCALHANVLQLFFGLVPPGGYQPLVELIREKRLHCGVYFAYFVIEGLYRIGETALAYELLTGREEHSWYRMAESGATTCMEVWAPEQKWNTSWCHPWSSSPIYFYTGRIMGVCKDQPDGKRIRIVPQIPEGLEYATMELPLTDGMLRASFRRNDGRVQYTVEAPDTVDIIFEAPEIDFVRKT